MPKNINVINHFGKLKGWNNVTFNLLGRDVVGITEISYSDSTKKSNIMGAGGFPVGRTEENYEAKASITLLVEEVDGMRSSLPKGTRLQDIEPFDIPVIYETPSGLIVKDVIRNAEFLGTEMEIKQGDGSIAIKFELIVSHIDWDI